MQLTKEALEVIVKRNDFYRRSHHSIVIANIVLVLILALVVCYLHYQKTTLPAPKYFPTTPDGRLIEVPAVSENHLKLSNFSINPNGMLIGSPTIYLQELTYRDADPDNALVLYWAEQAVLSLYDYDYVNYAKTLQEVRDLFTMSGHQQFLIKLNESNNLKAVKKNKHVVSGRIAGTSKVIKEGLNQGHKAWKIHVPVDVIYNNAVDEPLFQKLMVELFIARVSTLTSPFYGLAIYRTIISVRETPEAG